MSVGGRIDIRPERLIVELISAVTPGGEKDFEITSDVKGARLPNQMEILGIHCTPLHPDTEAPVETIRRLSFYRKKTRNQDELVYDDNWTDATQKSSETSIDNSGFGYVNQDEENKILGKLSIKSGEASAKFRISIIFR